jgi:hypothetical protein
MGEKLLSSSVSGTWRPTRTPPSPGKTPSSGSWLGSSGELPGTAPICRLCREVWVWNTGSKCMNLKPVIEMNNKGAKTRRRRELAGTFSHLAGYRSGRPPRGMVRCLTTLCLCCFVVQPHLFRSGTRERRLSASPRFPPPSACKAEPLSGAPIAERVRAGSSRSVNRRPKSVAFAGFWWEVPPI